MELHQVWNDLSFLHHKADEMVSDKANIVIAGHGVVV
jgi:hypothetical protein